jgi:hypothetical protein
MLWATHRQMLNPIRRKKTQNLVKKVSNFALGSRATMPPRKFVMLRRNLIGTANRLILFSADERISATTPAEPGSPLDQLLALRQTM